MQGLPMNIPRAINLSKWYGEVLGVQDLSIEFAPGITAVVGPNGSGKSTLFRLLTGQLAPNQGEVSLWGVSPWNDRKILARVGYAPEGEGGPGRMPALTWVTGLAELSGFASAAAHARAAAALDAVRLAPEARNRPLGTYSNGMRQKAKLAQALVHEPDLLILDEPLSGVDPASRIDLVSTLKALGAAGKTVVLSSHSLADVSRLTDRIALLFHGRLIAAGRVPEIRRLLDRYPYRIRIECSDPRKVGGLLAGRAEIVRISFPAPETLVAETAQGDPLFDALPGILAAAGVTVRGFFPEDESLESVFEYLVKDAGKGVKS